MLKKSRIAVFAATGLLAALTVGSLVVASNMGFKGRFTFTANVNQWFSPPYTSPYATADALLSAAAPTSGGRITRTVASAPPGFQFWTGSSGNGTPQNFVLKPGEGYNIVPNANEDVVIVGAHDPFVTIPAGQDGLPPNPSAGIPAGGSLAPGLVANRDYLVSVPWHTTYNTAEDLRLDVPGAQRVVRLDQAPGGSPQFFFWTGTDGNDSPKNYALELGRAYEVRVLSSSAGFRPAHF